MCYPSRSLKQPKPLSIRFVNNIEVNNMKPRSLLEIHRLVKIPKIQEISLPWSVNYVPKVILESAWLHFSMVCSFASSESFRMSHHFYNFCPISYTSGEFEDATRSRIVMAAYGCTSNFEYHMSRVCHVKYLAADFIVLSFSFLGGCLLLMLRLVGEFQTVHIKNSSPSSKVVVIEK